MPLILAIIIKALGVNQEGFCKCDFLVEYVGRWEIAYTCTMHMGFPIVLCRSESLTNCWEIPTTGELSGVTPLFHFGLFTAEWWLSTTWLLGYQFPCSEGGRKTM